MGFLMDGEGEMELDGSNRKAKRETIGAIGFLNMRGRNRKRFFDGSCGRRSLKSRDTPQIPITRRFHFIIGKMIFPSFFSPRGDAEKCDPWL